MAIDIKSDGEKKNVIRYEMDELNEDICSSDLELFYQKSYTLAKDVLKDKKFIGVPPYFFEIYTSKRSKGILVDVNRLEINVLDKRMMKTFEKLNDFFKENNLDYKVII